MSQTVTSTLTSSTVAAIRLSIFNKNVVQTVASTLALYDFVVLLDQEIHFIWLRPKTRWSTLYFLSRYGGLLCFLLPGILYTQQHALNPTLCYFYNELHVVLFDCLVLSILITLQLRVAALYIGAAYNRVMKATWVFAVIHACVIIGCNAAYFSIDRYNILEVDSQNIICDLVADAHLYSSLSSLDEGARVAHATLPLSLALWKVWGRFREVRQFDPDGSMSLDPDNPVSVTNGVIKVLLRDTVVYVVSGFVIVNALGWSTNPNFQIATVALEAASCVLVSRMIINLKSTYDDLTARLDGNDPMVSELKFVRRDVNPEPPREEEDSRTGGDSE